MREKSAWPILYNTLGVPSIEAALFVTSFWSDKAGLARKGQKQTLATIAGSVQKTKGKEPRLWFHAASAGELLQIKPLLEKLHQMHSRGSFLLTFFSPSAEDLATSCEHKDMAFYLPGDRRRSVHQMLTTFKPNAILFSRYDIWPNLVWESSRMGVKLAIVGATLHERSGRLRFGAKSLYRSVHRHFDFVGASTEEDATLYMKLDVDPDCIVVTGDMRYDQTYQRAHSPALDHAILAPLKLKGKVLVAGSTWPDDDKLLIPAYAQAREKHGDLKLILVPHEIRESQLADAEAQACEHSLSVQRYSQLKQDPNLIQSIDVALVDEVGFLAHVYSLGAIAYVGGGFGSGVHNVMEPACFGVPVFIGPQWSGSREAALMLRKGAAFEVRRSDGLANLLVDILERQSWRKEAGEKALEVVKENLGATEKTVAELHKRFPGIFG